MLLDLSEIAIHLGKRMAYEIDEPGIDEPESGLRCTAPIEGEVTFTNAGRHIVARGGFRTTVELQCARCLRMCALDLRLPIEEELALEESRLESAGEVEEEEGVEETSELFFADQTLDLTGLLRQSIILALPIKPLCSETCAGLCARCGRNLNDGPCGCPPDNANQAFSVLASLLEEEKPEGKELD